MSIKPSASTEIRTLIAALSSGDDIRRETAIARLAIIGPRAVDRLLATYASADRETRIGILRALEAIGDPRAVRVASDALSEGGDLAVTAAGTLRVLLDSTDTSSTQALDALVATALSSAAERRVRVAAFDALRDMPEDIREGVATALADPREHELHQPSAVGGTVATSHDALWQDALEGHLPDDPATLREVVGSRAESTPLGVLHQLVDAVRARERETDNANRRAAWRGLRGAVHQALGLRGSTIALYDLRETLEQTREPLPASFIGALHAVGDGSCLEAVAAAHAGAPRAGEAADRWRAQLEAAFKAIAAREKISRKSPLMKRIAKRWPAAADALLPPPTSRKTRR
jgi:HEAT repeat protein